MENNVKLSAGIRSTESCSKKTIFLIFDETKNNSTRVIIGLGPSWVKISVSRGYDSDVHFKPKSGTFTTSFYQKINNKCISIVLVLTENHLSLSKAYQNDSRLWYD